MEIWEPKPPGTLWATPGLLRDCSTFTFFHSPRRCYNKATRSNISELHCDVRTCVTAYRGCSKIQWGPVWWNLPFFVPISVFCRVKFEVNADNTISAVLHLTFHMQFIQTSSCCRFWRTGRKRPWPFWLTHFFQIFTVPAPCLSETFLSFTVINGGLVRFKTYFHLC
jgi:hypothetical protein